MRNFFRKSSKVTAETARRVTGISTPVFGVSWSDPGPSETEIVRRFLMFLEDRRCPVQGCTRSKTPPRGTLRRSQPNLEIRL